MPITITAAANGIKSHEVQPLAAGTGTGATAAGVLADSEDELAASEVASAAGVPEVSEGELAVTGGLVVAAAWIADCFPALAGSRAE